MDILKSLGLDPASRVKNEEFDRATGQIKDYGLMDWVGSSLLGQDLSQLNQAAQAQSDRTINNRFSGARTELNERFNSSGLSLDAGVLSLRPTETATEYNARLTQQARSLDGIDRARGVHGLDVSSLTENGKLKGLGAIEAAITKATREDPQGAVQRGIRAENREQTRHEEDQDWKRFMVERDAVQRDRDRADRKENLLLQIQQNNLDRAFRREQSERAEARADRKDRTAMLMQMVQGLSKLGYGMSI